MAGTRHEGRAADRLHVRIGQARLVHRDIGAAIRIDTGAHDIAVDILCEEIAAMPDIQRCLGQKLVAGIVDTVEVAIEEDARGERAAIGDRFRAGQQMTIRRAGEGNPG